MPRMAIGWGAWGSPTVEVPFLVTDRLILRRFTDADVDHLLALHNDPDVMRYLTGGEPISREEIERRVVLHAAPCAGSRVHQTSASTWSPFSSIQAQRRSASRLDISMLNIA